MNIDQLIEYVQRNRDFLEHNAKALDIYEGNLLQYVREIMQKTLSPNYFKTIEHRLVPVNVLARYVEKLAKVYAYPVKRTSNYQEWVDAIAQDDALDSAMLMAEEMTYLHKGYLLEPYLNHDLMPSVRVLPYDRFLPISTDPKDPTRMTAVIKFMGKVSHKGADVELYHYYNESMFLAFTRNGVYEDDMIDDNGEIIAGNPLGFIPFVYGNRSRSKLIPTPDSDLLQITQMMAILLSDLGGSVMYQCFSIIYGINVKTANLEMSPNAFWDIKGDAKAETAPTIGTIKPTADVDKVLSYIGNMFTLWLETKGIRIGSTGSLDGTQSASGISKIIDEMDTSEVRKRSMKQLRSEETNLWYLMAKMNNYWIESVPEYRGQKIGEDFEISIEYSESKPQLSRKEEVETAKMEYDAGFIDAAALVEKLYPDLEGEEFIKRVIFLEGKRANSDQGQEPAPESQDIEEV